MIKIFNTRQGMRQATPSAQESTLFYVAETNEVVLNGVMVVVARPKAGDICAVDPDKKIRFITLESFTLTKLPADWQAIGFVEWVRGRKVKVNRVLGNYKWSEYCRWSITGVELDGEEHAFSFKFTVSGTAYTCSGNYSGTTLAEVAASMNAIVKDFDFGGHQFHVYLRNGVINLQHDTYTAYLACTATGVTATLINGEEIPASSATPHWNGQKTGEGAVVNMDRALIYFRSDLSSTTYNPNTDVTSIKRAYPVCLPAYLGTSAYQSDHCAYLRNIYGPGEEGWMNYMKSTILVWPSKQGVLADSFGDGKTNTYVLAGQKAENHAGESVALYPAFDALAAVAFDADGLRAGDWFLDTIGPVAEFRKQIRYPAIYQKGVGSVSITAANADVYSQACAKLGMTMVANNANAWSSSRSGGNAAWSYNGVSGYAGSSHLYSEYQVVASSLLELPEAD